MTKKTYFHISATVFTVVALMHVSRLVLGWQIIIGGFFIPLWASALGLIFAGALAYYGWLLENK